MFTTTQGALALFTDLTENAALPLAQAELRRSPRFQQHDHVFFGDLGLRRYKHNNRWGFDDRDVRRVGQKLADMAVDFDDVVEVRFPAYRDLLNRTTRNWRHQVANWMYARARDQQTQEDWGSDSWTVIGANGLPGTLTWETFIAADNQPIAGTLPLQMLRWSGKSWLAPRSYVQMMDRWQEREAEMTATFRTCCSCGAQSPEWGEWRTPTPAGYITRCPACSAAAFPPYTGQLDGVQYEITRRRSRPARDYLCRLCGLMQASAWDHCHDHGFVRGPVCASCNGFEGVGFADEFLRQGGAEHLLQCRSCRVQRILPARYHAGVVQLHVESSERHGRCRQQPSVRALDDEAGVYRYALRCASHTPVRQWTVTVTAEEAASLVDAFVDGVIAEMHRGPEGLSA
ncbi:endonuclease domain-containing protein [Streptomyces europaeiscabiei]|uniref:endonuclease domain-containing protein n=1 Tax=Streptomyces europaeiscabiei TaxID=146819 RepID=UPI0029B5005B|nr:endonuclease domain-containing protein [Streptomyces europaeiscabiei]MDX3697825.1 endonuclease domain-containing protein [Streptomyces europaeiscabiei]